MTSPESPTPWSRAPWTTASSRDVYANRWIKLREDIAMLPDGRTTLYGVVECSEAVGVLPFLDRDTALMVGQYRYVARGFFWEIPTAASTPTRPWSKRPSAADGLFSASLRLGLAG